LVGENVGRGTVRLKKM